MKKLLLIFTMILTATFAFSESGQLHLIFSNGSATNNSYEFDVQAYMSGGSDVISEGMIYVEYPEAVFGSVAVYNSKVSVELTGILAGSIESLGMDRYRLVNVTDNSMNKFAVTFESLVNYMLPQYKSDYEAVSTDPANPSDLMHITMLAETEGTGEVLFPASIPGLDYIFYDYEIENFDGGLDIAEAIEAVDMGTDDPVDDPVVDDPVVDDPVVDDPVVDDPVFAGAVDLASFSTSVKKTTAEIKWTTNSETKLDIFIVQRSANGGEYTDIASVAAAGTSTKRQRYSVKDDNIVNGVQYDYRLVARDIHGVSEVVSTVSLKALESEPIGRGKKKVVDNDVMTQQESYPNPFNPSFTVPFTLHTAQTLDIKLYDMSGKVVANVATGYHAAGTYNINVNCNDMGSGVYLLRTQINGISATQKMLLVK